MLIFKKHWTKQTNKQTNIQTSTKLLKQLEGILSHMAVPVESSEGSHMSSQSWIHRTCSPFQLWYFYSSSTRRDWLLKDLVIFPEPDIYLWRIFTCHFANYWIWIQYPLWLRTAKSHLIHKSHELGSLSTIRKVTHEQVWLRPKSHFRIVFGFQIVRIWRSSPVVPLTRILITTVNKQTKQPTSKCFEGFNSHF